jgi:hypothetical protein
MSLVKQSFAAGNRGQAFVETLLFLPMLFLALTAVIFFARFGVLSERAESAVRYGDLVSFRGGNAYSVSAIGYLLNQAVFGNSQSQLLGLCLAPATGTVTPNPTQSGVQGDILAALSQTQIVNPNATAAPSPQAFFRPDGVVQPNCGPGSVDLNGDMPNGNSAYTYPAGNLPLSVDTFSITAEVGLSENFMGTPFAATCTLSSGSACSSTTANMAFINVAAPTTLIACVPGINIVLTIMNPAATTKPACN